MEESIRSKEPSEIDARGGHLYVFKQYTKAREKIRKAKKEVDWAKTSSSHSESNKSTTDDSETDSEDEGNYRHKNCMLEKSNEALEAVEHTLPQGAGLLYLSFGKNDTWTPRIRKPEDLKVCQTTGSPTKNEGLLWEGSHLNF